MLDLSTQALTRITDDPAIDTEAAWSSDGQSLYFTSDRAGGPQIYRVGVRAGDKPERITFGGSYNARPRLSPDGTQLAMVTLDGGNYRIAIQDLASGNVRVLSKGRQDESPSFAPNGAMLIYSGSEGGRSMLATVLTDALDGPAAEERPGPGEGTCVGSVRSIAATLSPQGDARDSQRRWGGPIVCGRKRPAAWAVGIWERK